VSSRHNAKYHKTALRVGGSVRASDIFACTGAGTGRVENLEARAFYAISI